MKAISLKILFLLSYLFMMNSSVAQTVLIKNKVPNDFSNLDNDKGPNRKKYSYSSFGLGKIINTSIQDSVLSVKWNALRVSFGYTGKYQANNYLGLLLGVDFSMESYALKKIDSSNTISYHSSINKARYVFYKISTDLAVQFNLKPNRGNQLGTYFALGGYVDYSLARRFVTKSTFDNGYDVKQKNVVKKPSFTTPFQYGLLIKYGKHNWAFFARYRMSNAFNNGQIELPRLVVGVELLLHGRG